MKKIVKSIWQNYRVLINNLLLVAIVMSNTQNAISKTKKSVEEKYQWIGALDEEKRRVGLWLFKSETGKVQREINYKSGKKHGKFIWYYKDGKVQRRKSYHNGNLHGSYKEYFRTGKLKFDKYFEQDLLHGEYKVYYKSGQIKLLKNYQRDRLHGAYAKYFDRVTNSISVSGSYNQGKKSKIWSSWSAYGEKIHKETYISGSRHGTCRYYIFGNLYKTEIYRNGILNGAFVQYFLDKNQRKSIEGEYRNGLSSGRWIYWRYSGNERLKTITYNKGVKHGQMIRFDVQGRLWKKYNYVRDKLEGKFIEYFSELKKVRITGQYSNEKLSGEWRYYFPNQSKVVKIINYKNDRKEGESKQFYSSGKLWKIVYYSKDKIDGVYSGYFDNAKNNLAEKGVYKNGEKTGRWMTYYSTTGKKREMLFYSLGKLHGFYTKYFPYGRTWIKSNYKEGLLQGSFVEYYNSEGLRKRLTGEYNKGDKIGDWFSWSYKQIQKLIVEKSGV